MAEGRELENELYEHYRIKVDAGQDLLRIDKFLMDRLPNVTRTKIQNGIKDGFVTVNGGHVKPNYKAHPGDEVIVAFPQPQRDTEIQPENIPLHIIMEDEHLLIVNKPAGMVVHPAHQNWSGTLVNALAYHFRNLPEMEGHDGRPGLVHRIDKHTSGLLVLAKTQPAMSGLAKQFFDHTIERTYLALVWGVPGEGKGTIDVNLGRSLKDRRVTAAFPEGNFGRRAITHYEIVQDLRYVSLVKCNLETGRTHQIRAHMKYLGHPLFSDETYGGNEILKGTIFTKYRQFVQNCFKVMPRQALHAKTLGFEHPITKERIFADSRLPDDFQQVLQKWERYVGKT
ncbi:MAG: RluA family pseudouridine synthase [Ekhidna sp.]|nr:RluA family pseudouridine synthase [Ekhidna sp.]